MKPEWLLFAERVRMEIDQMPARKSGKNVERVSELAPAVFWGVVNSLDLKCS